MPITLKKPAEEDLLARGMKEGTDGARTYPRRWKLELDLSAATTAETDAIEKHVEALVPVARYAEHPSYGAAFARDLELKPLGRDVWEAAVTYATFQQEARSSVAALPSGSGGNPPKPDRNQDKSTPANNRLPEIWITRKERKKPLEKDAANGALVKNPAGDPYDPPLEADRSLRTIHVKFWRYVSGYDVNALMDLMDGVNDAAVTILGKSYPAKTLWIADIAPKLVWDTIEFGGNKTLSLVWEISLALDYDPATHQAEVLAAGKRARPGIGQDPRTITDGTGNPVTDPVPLDANGLKLASGGTPVYQMWNKFVPVSFATLFA